MITPELRVRHLEDGSQFGISLAAFEGMEEDEQRELMLQWFYENFEDPQNETLRDDETKEYLYYGAAHMMPKSSCGTSLATLFPRP
jgi:hypothetical protein